jgi:hypothetical protein
MSKIVAKNFLSQPPIPPPLQRFNNLVAPPEFFFRTIQFHTENREQVTLKSSILCSAVAGSSNSRNRFTLLTISSSWRRNTISVLALSSPPRHGSLRGGEGVGKDSVRGGIGCNLLSMRLIILCLNSHKLSALMFNPVSLIHPTSIYYILHTSLLSPKSLHTLSFPKTYSPTFTTS